MKNKPEDYIKSLDAERVYGNKNEKKEAELYSDLVKDLKSIKLSMTASVGATIASVSGDVFDILSRLYEGGLDISILSSPDSMPLPTLLSSIVLYYFKKQNDKYNKAHNYFLNKGIGRGYDKYKY